MLKIKNENTRNPIQPLQMDDGTMRFKANHIIRDLYDFTMPKGFDMNHIVGSGKYSQDDIEQFYQLIGFSLTGFHEVSYVSDETALEASKLAKQVNSKSGGCRDNGCEIHIGVERDEI